MFSMLLLLMMLAPDTIEMYQCTDLDKLTSVQQGQRLMSHTFLSLGVTGTMHCAQACLNRKQCKSFNTFNRYCELNLNTSAETGSLESSDDWSYSDIDGWPKAVSKECSSHTCNYTQMCQASLPTLCHQCSDATECGVCYPVTEVSGRLFRSYGCYHSSPNVLSTLLVNLRNDIDWTDMTKTILGCAAAAVSSGYDFFGIEYYGECYAGNVAEANFQTPVSVNDCGEKCWSGVGASNVMFIYQWL